MEQKKLKGKAEFLGWGFVSGAYGPVISITRCLLDGCRLVMWTDAGIWYMENNEAIEAIFEPIPEAAQRSIYVHGIRRMPPANAYVLATDFAGEFGILLYREDQNGERIFLWGDDYIFK